MEMDGGSLGFSLSWWWNNNESDGLQFDENPTIMNIFLGKEDNQRNPEVNDDLFSFFFLNMELVSSRERWWNRKKGSHIHMGARWECVCELVVLARSFLVYISFDDNKHTNGINDSLLSQYRYYD